MPCVATLEIFKSAYDVQRLVARQRQINSFGLAVWVRDSDVRLRTKFVRSEYLARFLQCVFDIIGIEPAGKIAASDFMAVETCELPPISTGQSA